MWMKIGWQRCDGFANTFQYLWLNPIKQIEMYIVTPMSHTKHVDIYT
jgi:hypothetical protein